MKKSILILIIALIVILTSSYTHTSLPIELIQAIQAKKICVVVGSTGAHSGKCIELKIKNLTNVPYTLTVTAGTIFIPEDEGEQTLIVPQNNVFVLQPAENKSIPVGGYCTELSDRCPQTSSTFTIAKNASQPLSDLIRFMIPLRNLDESLIQQSIWCVTDNQSITNISLDTDPNSKAIRTFLFKQRGEADPLYSTTRRPEMAANRSIRNSAMEVTGKINIKAEKPVELIGVVKNEAGEVVWKYPYRTSLPVGDLVFDFKLKVTNWKAGNYYMIYTSEGAELVNQKFTI